MAPEEASGQPITVKADDVTAAQRLAAVLEQVHGPGDHQGATMVTEEQVRHLDTALLAFLRRNDALATGYEPHIPTLFNDPKWSIR